MYSQVLWTCTLHCTSVTYNVKMLVHCTYTVRCPPGALRVCGASPGSWGALQLRLAQQHHISTHHGFTLSYCHKTTIVDASSFSRSAQHWLLLLCSRAAQTEVCRMSDSSFGVPFGSPSVV